MQNWSTKYLTDLELLQISDVEFFYNLVHFGTEARKKLFGWFFNNQSKITLWSWLVLRELDAIRLEMVFILIPCFQVLIT